MDEFANELEQLLSGECFEIMFNTLSQLPNDKLTLDKDRTQSIIDRMIDLFHDIDLYDEDTVNNNIHWFNKIAMEVINRINLTGYLFYTMETDEEQDNIVASMVLNNPSFYISIINTIGADVDSFMKLSVFFSQTNEQNWIKLFRTYLANGVEINYIDHEGYDILTCGLQGMNVPGHEILEEMIKCGLNINKPDTIHPLNHLLCCDYIGIDMFDALMVRTTYDLIDFNDALHSLDGYHHDNDEEIAKMKQKIESVRM